MIKLLLGALYIFSIFLIIFLIIFTASDFIKKNIDIPENFIAYIQSSNNLLIDKEKIIYETRLEILKRTNRETTIEELKKNWINDVAEEKLKKTYETKNKRNTEFKKILNNIPGDDVICCLSTFNYMKYFKFWLKSAEKIIPNIKKIVIVFALDLKTFEECKKMNVPCYYEKIFGDFSESNAYGDTSFNIIMHMKNVSITSILENSNKNLLFQDVDLIWFKNPFDLCKNQPYDIMYMEDHNSRFSPTYVNSGFMYIKNNKLTKNLYNACLDDFLFILALQSHQQPMNYYIQYFMKNHNLKIKTLDNKKIFDGSGFKKNLKNNNVYVIHYNWTENKDAKDIRIKEIEKAQNVSIN